MVTVIIIILGLICIVSSETDITPKEFVINMDEAASVRWAKPCEEFGKYDMDIYENMTKLFPDLFVEDLEEIMLNWYIKNAQEPYKSEMQYFAECSGVPLGGIVAINLIYDMTAFCTSIVAEDENGIIYHGRNLDYGDLPLLRNGIDL